MKALAARMVALGMMATAFGQTAAAGLYVPIAQSIVDAMLAMGGVTAKDRVLDLGCGDGRIAPWHHQFIRTTQSAAVATGN